MDDSVLKIVDSSRSVVHSISIIQFCRSRRKLLQNETASVDFSVLIVPHHLADRFAMDDDLLRKIVAEIDELPRDGERRSHISIGKPGSYIFITANRQGLISLARAFLTAAISPPASGVEGLRPTTLEAPHLQVLHSKEDVAIGWIEHADIVPIPEETISERQQQGWNNDRFALFGCALVGFMILFLIVSGLSLWIGIITGSPRHS